VTPSGRRISLKGAVAHFFLSFLLPFPSSRNNLFPTFPNRRNPFLSHTSLPLRAVCSPPPSSRPRCAPSARRRPCPVPAARRLLASVLVLSATRSPPDPVPLHTADNELIMIPNHSKMSQICLQLILMQTFEFSVVSLPVIQG